MAKTPKRLIVLCDGKRLVGNLAIQDIKSIHGTKKLIRTFTFRHMAELGER